MKARSLGEELRACGLPRLAAWADTTQAERDTALRELRASQLRNQEIQARLHRLVAERNATRR